MPGTLLSPTFVSKTGAHGVRSSPDEIGAEDDGLVAVGADAEDGGGGACVVFDESDVVLHVFGEVIPGARAADVFAPTGKRLVLGLNLIPLVGGAGEVIDRARAKIVGGADLEVEDILQSVEPSDDEAAEAV